MELLLAHWMAGISMAIPLFGLDSLILQPCHIVQHDQCNLPLPEELNDFLPAERRRQSFTCECTRGATVKHMIEALQG
ncbi:mut7-C ubiquitin family protein [Pseudomonas fluorescens]|uniref:Mut7-C ubiquitin family protein n=1 Tax=Pseudomonas fluorescens TaxID=294 RepID=A0A0P8X4D3_PSEFL|nr:mut7-C ubiquitin family protein [Pseudomonas fluorescens]